MTEVRWLSGWKQIARHFQVSRRTVIYWADHRGMPVVRDGGTVSAEIPSLDRWRKECRIVQSSAKECNDAN